MTIHIKIGEVETLLTEDWDIIPDDRQTQIETIGGKVIQDFGLVEDNENYACSVTLKSAFWETVKDYWHNRTPVTVRDIAENEIHNLRVVVKKYNYVNRYEKEYMWAKLEFWRDNNGS